MSIRLADSSVMGPPATGPPTVYVDRLGDLTLAIGPNKAEFVVCSRALARCSPVFNAMLNGGFKESRPADTGQPWVVTLPEDDPDASEIFLHIVHARFHLVPETMPASRLHSLLVIVDKYDMLPVVRPWIRSWLSGIKWPRIDDSECKINIAWAVGAAIRLERSAQSLCWHARVGYPAGYDATQGYDKLKLIDRSGLIVRSILSLDPPELFGKLSRPAMPTNSMREASRRLRAPTMVLLSSGS